MTVTGRQFSGTLLKQTKREIDFDNLKHLTYTAKCIQTHNTNTNVSEVLIFLYSDRFENIMLFYYQTIEKHKNVSFSCSG